MHILLYNCLERLEGDLTALFKAPEVNVFLAVSQSDVIRILNSTRIDEAALAVPDIDRGLLHVLHAYSQTQFYLFDTPRSAVARYDNLHAIGPDGGALPLQAMFAHHPAEALP